MTISASRQNSLTRATLKNAARPTPIILMTFVFVEYWQQDRVMKGEMDAMEALITMNEFWLVSFSKNVEDLKISSYTVEINYPDVIILLNLEFYTCILGGHKNKKENSDKTFPCLFRLIKLVFMKQAAQLHFKNLRNNKLEKAT